MPDFLDNERRVLEFLKQKQTATNTSMAKELSLSEKMVNEILHVLRQSGYIQFIQDFHLTRGELIMAKITGKGITSLQGMPAPSSGEKSAGGGYNFDKISRAIAFASEAHRAEFRKGNTIPYIVHPLDVLSILLKNGASEDLAIAGVLHDVLEDTPRSRDEIRQNFGDKVCSLVEDASEEEKLTKGVSNEEKKKTWKLRKQQKINKVRDSGRDLRLLICADKLANIRDMIADYRIVGDALWSKFNASKDQESWYYHEMALALISTNTRDPSVNIADTSMFRELDNCIQLTFGAQ